MKKLFYSLLLANILLLASPALAQESDFNQSSLVIVKIPELTGEQYYQISSGLATNTQYSLEYSCLESGIIVLRYYHNFTEEADVRTAVRSLLKQYGKLTSLEVIYVDLSQEAATRC
ncbi:MAG: hypothetical protein WA960_22010 [Tunicatimonas sp.]